MHSQRNTEVMVVENLKNYVKTEDEDRWLLTSPPA